MSPVFVIEIDALSVALQFELCMMEEEIGKGMGGQGRREIAGHSNLNNSAVVCGKLTRPRAGMLDRVSSIPCIKLLLKLVNCMSSFRHLGLTSLARTREAEFAPLNEVDRNAEAEAHLY